MVETLTTPQGRTLAYRRQAGAGPGIVFIHGFNSDMGGTKAEDLATWCADQGRAFLAFDLSGHGGSAGTVPEFGITDWREDAVALIEALTDGPQVLVGSSLGGWLAMLIARERPELVAGVVTAAAAPDFTARLSRHLSEAERADLAQKGAVTRGSAYGEDYVFSARLFDQGAAEAILTAPLSITAPVRMIHGTRDEDVPVADALALLGHAKGQDIRLTLIKDADHRLSDPASLAVLRQSIGEVLAAAG